MQHEHTEHVAASPDAAYAAISNVANLPRFVVDAADRRIEWAAPSGYRGWMKVDPDSAGSRLTLFLETIHGSERDYDIAATLGAIRMLVESEV